MGIIENIANYFFLPDQKKQYRMKRYIEQLAKIKYGHMYKVVEFDVKPYVSMGTFPFGKPDVFWFYSPSPAMIADYCVNTYNTEPYFDKSLEWLGINSKAIFEAKFSDYGCDLIRICLGDKFIFRTPFDEKYHLDIGMKIKEFLDT